MVLLFEIAFVLGMIYLAAIVLAFRDRLIPQPEYVRRVPRITQYPHFRTLRWFILPVLIPLWLFALTIWAIVYSPVYLWRGIARIAYRVSPDNRIQRRGQSGVGDGGEHGD